VITLSTLVPIHAVDVNDDDDDDDDDVVKPAGSN